MTDVIEKGGASINIELKDGVIAVTHGTDGSVLAQWTASGSDWDSIWKTIHQLEEAGN